MAIPLRQSTASQEIPLGVFVDALDGNTAETGLTLANTDIKIWKQGATALVSKNSGGGTHISGGIYYAVLDATDTNTLGGLVVFVHVSGALAVRVECVVLPAVVYDALIAGTDRLQVHVDEMTAGIITSTVIATGAIDADAVATDAVTEIQSGLATSSALSTVAGYLDTEIAAILADTNELQTDWANGGRLDSLVDGIKAKTDNLPADPADDSDIDAQLAVIAGYLDTEVAAILEDTGTTLPGLIAGLNDLSAAEVNAQVLDVLVTDTFGEPGSVPGATSSLKDKIGWLFMLARNKRTVTATADKVRNDGDSSDVGEATLSDDGSTFTRGEYS